MKSKIKPKLLIQVDCDSSLALRNHYGLMNEIEEFSYYEILNKFLILFDKYNIHATFFVIGKDLENPMNVEILKEVIKRGHEIGNHTYNHPASVNDLTFNQIYSEIKMTQTIVSEKLGVDTVGFRTPNFEISPEIIKALIAQGFLYDSSILPTPYSSVIRMIKRFSASSDANYLSKSKYRLALNQPYAINDKLRVVNKKDESNIFELPVSVSPTLRLPCHMSYLLAYPFVISKLLINSQIKHCTKRFMPYILTFHLTDCLEDKYLYGNEKRLFPRLEVREQFIEYVLENLVISFDNIVSSDYIRKFAIGG